MGLSETKKLEREVCHIILDRFCTCKDIEERKYNAADFVIHKNAISKTNPKIIYVYAQTSESQQDDAEKFYEELKAFTQKQPTSYTLILGNLNAKIGKSKKNKKKLLDSTESDTEMEQEINS